jgi:hypothetical protein
MYKSVVFRNANENLLSSDWKDVTPEHPRIFIVVTCGCLLPNNSDDGYMGSVSTKDAGTSTLTVSNDGISSMIFINVTTPTWNP